MHSRGAGAAGEVVDRLGAAHQTIAQIQLQVLVASADRVQRDGLLARGVRLRDGEEPVTGARRFAARVTEAPAPRGGQSPRANGAT
jgi:hypothetical protein